MSIYKIKNIIALFVVVSLTQAVTIKGSVYDQKTKEPLIGASVFIAGTSYGTASDIDGSYSINISQPSKTYNLKSTYIGYVEFIKEIEDLNNEDIYLDIFLESSSVEIDETTVTAQKRQDKVTDSPAAIEIVSAGDIKREEATNLGSYLKGIKGVDFTSSGINNYSISVRGFNSSFTSRLLTLTDGRIASMPALRVINYSTVPQSSKDIENIEIVLGPSTALYGANAHSGVVNITSKSPADSEGLDISISGSINDDRDLQKISSRWASKLTKNLSMKVSGMYLQGNEWEFIGEREYKLHTYPYTGAPGRVNDGKDNNPWRDDFAPLIYGTTNDNRVVRIGDGEPYADTDPRYDPDGDGVAGEDWFNGVDDDGDGLIDEDYFEIDGVDNDGDCDSDSNFDGCYCCGWTDANHNGVWDEGEIANGDDNVDEFIDVNEDTWFDGIDNDGNGAVDDNNEQFTGAQAFPNWSSYIENDVIVFNGRSNEYNYSEPFEDYGTDNEWSQGNTDSDTWDENGSEFNGEWDCPNPDECENFIDYNGDGVWSTGDSNPWYIQGNDILDNQHLRGAHYYDEESVSLLFDVFSYDYGEDARPGDYAFYDATTNTNYGFIDGAGNQNFEAWEGGNMLFQNQISSEGCLELPFSGNGQCGDDTDIWNSNFDCGLDGLCEGDEGWLGIDYGEGNGIWDNFDWNDDGAYNDGDIWNSASWSDSNNDGIPNTSEFDSWEDTYPYGNNQYNSNDMGDILLDCGQDGLCFGDEGYEGMDAGEGDGLWAWDNGELDGVYDLGDNCFGCEAEKFDDNNNNGIWNYGEGYVDDNLGDYGSINLEECQIIGGIFWDDNNDGIGYCGDGQYTLEDYQDNFAITDDVNGDGISDYPDFEVKNAKAEVRLDYDPTRDLNISFQTGYSWSKLQQITGTGRYLADGYKYTFYQLRGRYKNMFAQIYLNQGNSGETRGYDLGNVIYDQSKNIAFQFQHNFDIPNINTNIVWGMDLFKLIANTNGSLLNDGPNGYDNNGNQWFFSADEIDNDGDSNDWVDLNGNGYPDPGDFDPNILGPDGEFGTEDDDLDGPDNILYTDDDYATGVNPQGFVYADGVDNDEDSLDPDGDNYPTFQEIYAGTDPFDGTSAPFGSPIANTDWAIDEMIDEEWCTDDSYYQEYYGFVPAEYFSGTRNGRLWECNEGIDEADEFFDVGSLEQGLYVQSKTNFNGKFNRKWELVTAIRLDKHDKLKEGIQVAPKFGLFYKPSDAHTFRLTYGKAYNTPGAITLYTDLFIRRIGPMLYYLRGNKDGTPYERVGAGQGANIQPPQMMIDNQLHYIGEAADAEYWSGMNDAGNYVNYNAPYEERVEGAPYFLTFQNSGFINVPDYIPLDTALYTVYVPELSDTGRVYTALEALHVPDVDPIRTEKIQTIEIGFKGFLTERIHASIDYYTSFYEDFFSSPTIVTPLIVKRNLHAPNGTNAEFAINNIVGLLPMNYNSGNAPFGTQWDGLDNDNDWSSNTSLPFYENNLSFDIDNQNATAIYGGYGYIDFDNPIYNVDTDGDGEDDAFNWSESEGFDWAGNEAPGQWGLVDYILCGEGAWSGVDASPSQCSGIAYGDTLGFTLYHPEDVVNTNLVINDGVVDFNVGDGSDFWVPVGIDEYSPIGGLSEAEMITSPIIGADGNALVGPGTSFTPLHSILAPMNYGEVNMQGIDLGLAYLFPEYNLAFDLNLSFYSSTEYYNSLTKKNDPINAPKFKMNGGVSWKSPIGNIALKYRHVNKFEWSDGIWKGTLGPYDLFDLLYSIKINDYLEINLTGQNIFDFKHKQILGGAIMGRQIIMRLSASL